MNMDAVKDFLNNFFENFFYKVRESFIFNTIMERYESLDSRLQKWIQYVLWTAGLALVFYFPFSIFMSSAKSMEDFKNKKTLISNLLKTNNSLTSAQTGLLRSEFDVKISSVVDKMVFSSDQEVRITAVNRTPFLPKSLKSLNYTVKEIQIKGLNIKEAVEIGENLSRVSPYARILGFKVEEMKDKKNYFQTIFTIVSFFNAKSAPKITPLVKKPAK